MKRTVEAVYENGVFRPLEPLELAERERVTLTVRNGHDGDDETFDDEDWIDTDAIEVAEREGDASVTIEEVRKALSAIKGSLAQTVIEERGEY